jgi:EF-P beta-lysylation protein EpmB
MVVLIGGRSKLKWKLLLRDAITDPAELIGLLELTSEDLSKIDELFGLNLLTAQTVDLNQMASFPMRVPRNFVARMQKKKPFDPLLLQVLPLGLENFNFVDFIADPLEESVANPVPGLLHKYHGRVLLITNGHCAIQCRYCFRRHFEYQEQNPGQRGWQMAFDYIAADPSIHEVILSGGDPLTLTDQSLSGLLTHIQKTPHLKTLRFHSRVPVVLPERIDADFLALFDGVSQNKIMVIHCNHPQELDSNVFDALSKLKQAGFTLLNQSVLLKSINDTATVQIALQHKLFEYGVLPYYLHLLDKTKGVAHFEVGLTQAEQLIDEMRRNLPGYLVPRLARETPGEGSKTVFEGQRSAKKQF